MYTLVSSKQADFVDIAPLSILGGLAYTLIYKDLGGTKGGNFISLKMESNCKENAYFVS